MDFGVVVGALLRRWLIGLIGLLLACGAALAVYSATPRTYQSSSQIMVLLPPTAGSTVVESSPFLYLPNGLTTLARVVTLVPGTEEFRRSMIVDGFVDQYEVSVESQNPIVRFSVEGADPASVLATRDELMRRYATELERVQGEERVPRRQFAHVRTLEATREVVAVSGDRLRAGAVTGVLLGILTLLTMVVVDRVSFARAKRGRDEGVGEADIEGTAAPAENTPEDGLSEAAPGDREGTHRSVQSPKTTVRHTSDTDRTETSSKGVPARRAVDDDHNADPRPASS